VSQAVNAATKYKGKNTMKKRLESYIDNASLETIDHGMQWYSNAYKHCVKIAIKNNTNPVLVASVIAALSPRNRWTRNLIDADNVISHIFKGTPLQKCAVYTKMRDKAIKLCDDKLTIDDRLTILNGRKIQSFFTNILGLGDKVTVDTWIDLAYSGKYKATKKRKALTITRYRKIEKDIQSLAKKYDCKPYQLQAIIWLQYQNQLKA